MESQIRSTYLSALPYRQLDKGDALRFLDDIKLQFRDRPYVYTSFLDLMKDFKSLRIDTPSVLERVARLFHGYPHLLEQFNAFLPDGYRIEYTVDPNKVYIVTLVTPYGTVSPSIISQFESEPLLLGSDIILPDP
ncbi:hypothetical protein NLI96_g8724 [Meripilus lineatus]|uniref:Uncharacterized protein n=1 Tax=Meripilus lineatus TaxID=2056292 RepID=A0AAD5UWW7_9APHY|nr:hypothetical protein NLI96_g8724 [Physisporinus lineatus]